MPRTVRIAVRKTRTPKARKPWSCDRSRLQTACARAPSLRRARAIGGTFINHDMHPAWRRRASAGAQATSVKWSRADGARAAGVHPANGSRPGMRMAARRLRKLLREPFWLVLIACLIAGAIIGTLVGRETTDELTAAVLGRAWRKT